MLSVSCLIKSTIAALVVVAVVATAMAVVGKRRPPYATIVPEPASNAPQSTADGFRLEFASATIKARAVRHA